MFCVQSSFTGSTKEQVKRKFVTSHQLQQEHQKMKKKQKSHELPKRILTPRKCNLPPVAETPEIEQGTDNPKGTARRKLNLQEDKLNDTAVEVVTSTCSLFDSEKTPLIYIRNPTYLFCVCIR